MTAGAPPTAAVTRTSVEDPGKDGVRVTSLTLPAPAPSPTASRYALASGGLVTGADPGVSAAYEITNDGAEAMTYTVTLTFTSGDGAAVADATTTVPGVAPGKTVRGRVGAGALPPGAPRVTGAKITDVAEVPSAEARGADGGCPASGVRVRAGTGGEAAMGLRVVGLRLLNCGAREYAVEGYPALELLDEDRAPLGGVRMLRGSREITSAIEGAGPPHRVVLRPGESARASLVWRNTTDLGTPVTARYVRVRAKDGAVPETLPEHIDLGTTGRLGVTPWTRADR
ncbi:conserved hypothetical protein [Streptomyces sp. SPB074]|nr:conserved hypothetical protein [Streptomyces sp. SPB074]